VSTCLSISIPFLKLLKEASTSWLMALGAVLKCIHRWWQRRRGGYIGGHGAAAAARYRALAQRQQCYTRLPLEHEQRARVACRVTAQSGKSDCFTQHLCILLSTVSFSFAFSDSTIDCNNYTLCHL
jgi:hypothetical protein